MNNKELAKKYTAMIKLYNERLSEVWPVYKKIVLDIFGYTEWPNLDETIEEQNIKQKIYNCIKSAVDLPEINKKIIELINEAKERISDGRLEWDSHERVVFFENY